MYSAGTTKREIRQPREAPSATKRDADEAPRLRLSRPRDLPRLYARSRVSFFYWRRQLLDFAFSEWLCICMSICGLGQSESVISLSRSATRCLLARLLSDDHRRHHPVLYRCAPRIPIDILLHLLTWVYSYRFQVTSVYVQCIGPDAYRETSPGQWVPITPPLAVQDCPCHIRKAA